MRVVYYLSSLTGGAPGKHDQVFHVVIVMLLLYTLWLGKSGCLVVEQQGGEETGAAT